MENNENAKASENQGQDVTPATSTPTTPETTPATPSEAAATTPDGNTPPNA